MSKPGYVSVSLDDGTDNKLNQISTEIGKLLPDGLSKTIGRAATIRFLIDHYNNTKKQ